jgi:hypothetical protein
MLSLSLPLSPSLPPFLALALSYTCTDRIKSADDYAYICAGRMDWKQLSGADRWVATFTRGKVRFFGFRLYLSLSPARSLSGKSRTRMHTHQVRGRWRMAVAPIPAA